MSTSRPNSAAFFSPGSLYHANPPTLAEILSNTSAPPWTLAAFMAYLSQNHCLETLEFTMDADRYSTAYNQILAEQPSCANDRVCLLWEKLMQAYIIPYAPREVNLPSRVRDRLLALSYTSAPPPPSELDDAVGIVYELMNDSVLLPFIESLSPAHPAYHIEEDMVDPRQGRSRLTIHGDAKIPR